MEIKTKLDLGDAVYFMSKNKIARGKIVSIKTISELDESLAHSLESKTHTIYLADVLGEDKYIEVNEKFAFETKEKLLESLWKNI